MKFFSNRLTKVLTSCFGLVLLLAAGQTQAYNVQYESIRFFEGGFEAPPLGSRTYHGSFRGTNARYIFAEIRLKNMFPIEAHRFEMRAEYFRPDGSFMGDPKHLFAMQPDWPNGHFWVGWGWRESGNWQPGTYRVKIYLNNQFVTESSFRVD